MLLALALPSARLMHRQHRHTLNIEIVLLPLVDWPMLS